MAVPLEQFSGLVSGIHAAALDSSQWRPALDALLATLGGAAGALFVAEPDSRRFRDTVVGIDAAAVASYDAHYGRLDPIPPVLDRAGAGTVLPGQAIIRPDALRRTEFYNDWARPIEAGDGIVASLLRGSDGTSWFCCSAPLRAERFATPERLRLMRLVVPHLQQALRAQRGLGEVAHVRDCALAAFEHSRNGVAWAAADGRIIHANAAAAAILRRGEGLSVQVGGQLRAALPAEDAAFRRALGLAALGDGNGVRSGTSLTICRPHGKRPFVAHVLPAAQDAASPGDPMAIVVIVDVDERADPPALLLRRLYGLTGAEATVALAILRHDTLQAVADELSVARSTVTTHLQRVFEKVGVRRQADLARILQMVDGGFARSDGEE